MFILVNNFDVKRAFKNMLRILFILDVVTPSDLLIQPVISVSVNSVNMFIRCAYESPSFLYFVNTLCTEYAKSKRRFQPTRTDHSILYL